MSQIEAIIAKAMTASKAWPSVFKAGSAAELARDSIAELDAAGFIVVPVDPTYEMLVAGDNAICDHEIGPYDQQKAEYIAMLAARPKP